MKLVLYLGIAIAIFLRVKVVHSSSIRVQDGDSVVIQGYRCRLVGLDAPEWDQAYGASSTRALREFISGWLIVIYFGRDAYNRSLVRLYGRKGPVTMRMLVGGHGHAEGLFGQLLVLWPRICRKGLWRGRPIHPSSWRLP